MIFLELSLDDTEDFLGEVALVRRDATPQVLRERLLLCADEPLADLQGLSFCSGVLVAPNVVVTATHCVTRYPCTDWFATTDYDLHPLPEPGTRAACQSVIATDGDVAVVRLANSLSEPPVPLRVAPVDEPEPAIFVSHPLGVHTQIDFSALVAPHPQENRLRVGADDFEGSSGGGFFDEQSRLMAVLSSGLPDFRYDETSECTRLGIYRGPPVELAYSPVPALKAACSQSPDEAFCAAVIGGAGEEEASGVPHAKKATSSVSCSAPPSRSDAALGGLQHEIIWVLLVVRLLRLRHRKSRKGSN